MIFKYSDKGISGKLYYFERKLINKYQRSRWHRNYTFHAENYKRYEPIKLRPYAQTITQFDLDINTDQIAMIAIKFNELVHAYNHMLDIENIEESYIY